MAGLCSRVADPQTVALLADVADIPALERVFAQCSRTEREFDGVRCLEFGGHRNRRGYGRISVAGTAQLVHRLVYAVCFGLPEHNVLHRCDNPPCCEPTHLYDGTQADNYRDATLAGSAYLPTPPPNIGVTNGQARVTEEQVRAIRRRVAAGESQNAMAREYGLGVMTVSYIVRWITWAHVA